MKVPFNRPSIAGKELDYVAQAFARLHVSGDGFFGRKSEAVLAEVTGAKRALLTTSCTHALEMSALLLDVGPGDEVIVPSFTFVSSVNAFVLRGATPIFADVRPDTLNIDENHVASLVGPKTKCVVAVHYAGIGCEMDALRKASRDVPIVEDNAHGLFGKWRGKPLGSFGALATQSFHETKNISCGEGGALLVNDDTLEARGEILREKGTNRSKFFRGQVDKYTWVDLGSSYVLSEILAAALLAQLEAREKIQATRQRVWERYRDALGDWAKARDAVLPTVPAHCEQAFHLFYLLLPTLEQRTRLIDHLGARGVKAVFHYVPLHLSPIGMKLGGKAGDCPVTESVSDRLLRLPLYSDMTDEEQAIVIDAVRSFS